MRREFKSIKRFFATVVVIVSFSMFFGCAQVPKKEYFDLELTVPKTEFTLGERINAKISFKNDSGRAWNIEYGGAFLKYAFYSPSLETHQYTSEGNTQILQWGQAFQKSIEIDTSELPPETHYLYAFVTFSCNGKEIELKTDTVEITIKEG